MLRQGARTRYEPGSTDLGSDLRTYIGQPGDQTLTLANGTYYVGTGAVTAPHAATAGTHDGFLILVAETQGGVTVNLSNAALRLLATTSRVVFVGMRFINGNVQLTGVDNIHFWYCEFTYPADIWHDWYLDAGGVPYPPAIPRTGGPPNRDTEWAKTTVNGNKSPQTPSVAGGAPYGRSTNVSFLGCDSHETGDDTMYAYDVDDLAVIGCRIWHSRSRTPVADGGSNVERDPGNSLGSSQDWIHNDGFQTVGILLRAVFADSWFGQDIQFAGEGKRLEDCTFDRIWLAGSSQFGMQAGTATNASGKILGCTMDTIRSFCNGQVNGSAYNLPTHDYDWGTSTTADWPSTIYIAGTFELIRTNFTLTIPSGVSTTTVSGVPILNDITQVRDHSLNPANIWRTANPYASYRAYLGI